MIQDGKNTKYFGYSGFEDFFEWYIVLIVFKNTDKISNDLFQAHRLSFGAVQTKGYRQIARTM